MASATQKHELALASCTPEPLMAYLKALGVFRLVAEQKDSATRACWRYDTFVLYTSLDHDALVRFFLEEYSPTPIVAPWNNRYKTGVTKGDPEGIDIIRASADARLNIYKEVIGQSKNLVEGDKGLVLAKCRNTLPDNVLPWLDAVYVLTTDTPRYPPLASAGGTVGTSASGDLSMNYMKNLVLALGLAKSGRRNTADPQQWLETALFAGGSSKLMQSSVGQFNPGGVGGPNATVGFEGESLINPWDFVLMLEGTLSFAGAVARRLSPESRAKALFPFTVDTSAVGYGTTVDGEYQTKSSRGEIWLPLWDHPAAYQEVAHVFAEGRAQLGPRQAGTGTDFARAIAGLGVERGITSFQRFGFLQRSGKDGFIVTPLGRFRVRANPSVDVLVDVDPWLSGLRRLTRGQNVPEGLSRLLRQIDQAIMDFCRVRDGQQEVDSARRLQDILIALGRAESWLAKSRAREQIPPLSSLRPEWLKQADDGSPEFRIAAAVASIQGSSDSAIGPLRVNLRPLQYAQGRWTWARDNPSVVWEGVDLVRDMAAVLDRRCLEARMRDGEQVTTLPVKGSRSVPLQDVVAFLEGRLDERRIADLVAPLTAVRWQTVAPEQWTTNEPELLSPLLYATLKLLFLPWKFRPNVGAQEVELKPEPSILPLLRAGRAGEAYQAAWHRLYVSGFTSLAREMAVPTRLSLRLPAALLIPIRYRDMYTLADMALMPASKKA